MINLVSGVINYIIIPYSGSLPLALKTLRRNVKLGFSFPEDLEAPPWRKHKPSSAPSAGQARKRDPARSSSAASRSGSTSSVSQQSAVAESEHPPSSARAAAARDDEEAEVAARQYNEQKDVGTIVIGCYAADATQLCSPKEFVRDIVWGPAAICVGHGFPPRYLQDCRQHFGGYVDLAESADGTRGVFAKMRRTTSMKVIAEITMSTWRRSLLGHVTVVAVEMTVPFCGMGSIVVAAVDLVDNGVGEGGDTDVIVDDLRTMILRTGARVLAGRFGSSVLPIMRMLRGKGVSICPGATSPFLDANYELIVHASMILLTGPMEDCVESFKKVK